MQFEAVSDQNAVAVAQVCRRLDGIPLAIELAAARVKALSVDKISERLDDMFRLLTGGSRTALPRQQTLRALIDWSYDLLSEPDRAFLRRLSVFAGGWPLEGAESVGAGEGMEEWEVLDRLTSLVEKSLVLYEEPGDREAGGREGRYRLLETVRQYARDRLSEAGEGEAVRDRHGAFFLQMAEAARAAAGQGKGAEAFERLEPEHDNLRAALAWSGESDAERMLRLAGAMGEFWFERGYWNEGRQWLERALAAVPDAEPTAGRARALAAAGRLATFHPDDPAARNCLEEGLALARQVGDRGLMSQALYRLGEVVEGQGEGPKARELLEESVELARAAKNKSFLFWALVMLGGVLSRQGDPERARSLSEECLLLARELRVPSLVAAAIRRLVEDGLPYEKALPMVEQAEAEYGPVVVRHVLWPLVARAPSYEEALQRIDRIERNYGPEMVVHALGGLGHVARERGDYEWAATYYRRSLALRQEAGDTTAVATSLEDFAGLAARQQQWVRAATLLGAAESVGVAIGRTPPVGPREPYEAAVLGARAALGEEGLAAAWA